MKASQKASAKGQKTKADKTTIIVIHYTDRGVLMIVVALLVLVGAIPVQVFLDLLQ